MPNVLEFTCPVVGGRIPLEVSRSIGEAFRKMEGKRLLISVREYKEKRSGNQNRYYWGVVVKAVHDMFVDAGNDVTPEEVHEYLKEYVGGSMFVKVIITPDEKRRTIVRSSTSLDTTEWEEFMERVRAWAAETGCVIPLPNES